MNREHLMQNPRFIEFLHFVQQEFDRLLPETPHRETALMAEKDGLEAQRRGWLQSLGNPSLPSAMRTALESPFEEAEARIKAIDAELSETAAHGQQKSEALDPELVADRLEQLDEILASENASAANVMLSQHVDGIFCDQDGEVLIRTCKLGALAGGLDLLPRDNAHMSAIGFIEGDQRSAYLATPRRRARLNIGAAIEDDDVADSINDFAADPQRFAGLGPEWFTEDVFQLPRRLSWAEANAEEVAEFRHQTHSSMATTAGHFGKTIPTIREALRYAKENLGIDAFGKSISRPTLPNWSRSSAAAVDVFFKQGGVTMKMAVAHFGKSEPTIRKALDFAKLQSAQQRTDEAVEDSETHDGKPDAPTN